MLDPVIVQIQDRLMEILRFTMDFCDRNGFRYFAGGGTLIGAIRHKGIIPWDDDIDLMMPREDYDRFLKEAPGLLEGSGYEIVAPGTEGYYLPFAKIVDRNSTLWEFKRYPFVIGLFIDIFPLDYFDCSREEVESFKKHQAAKFKLYALTLQRYDWGDFCGLVKAGNVRKVLEALAGPFFRFPGLKKHFLKRYLDDRAAMKSPSDPKLVVNLTVSFSRTDDAESYSSYELAPFGDQQMRIPSGWDMILRRQYGDYMKLPPEEKRQSRHQQYFIDFDRRMTLDEVKAAIRDGGKVQH